MKPFVTFITRAVSPSSRNEDVARREFILRVLLFGAIALLFIGVVINTIHKLFSSPEQHYEASVSSYALYALLTFFLALYVLSRRGLNTLASYLLLGAFFVLTAYMGYRWGVDVPAQIVLYPLVIVMAGILISTRFAFLVTVLIAATMIFIGWFQHEGLISVNTYWKSMPWMWSDIVMIILIYFIVATVAWLSNREIEKSLKRARKSEAELTKERDTLELRVEERTRELRQAEMEKMSQAYRFVEFGRLASGIFHDLMNPLAALSLNIDRIAEAPGTRTALSDDVARAKRAALHMQKLMDSMRTHLSREGKRKRFSLKRCLKDIVQILTPYARSRGVRLTLTAGDTPRLYGDPVAFTQVMTNLISNAVQAYPPLDRSADTTGREVIITLTSDSAGISVSVADTASGIAPENLENIFEPFFTTKDTSDGLGIGLSLAKRIIEKRFEGTLSVESALGAGSTFTVYLPIREP